MAKWILVLTLIKAKSSSTKFESCLRKYLNFVALYIFEVAHTQLSSSLKMQQWKKHETMKKSSISTSTFQELAI